MSLRQGSLAPRPPNPLIGNIGARGETRVLRVVRLLCMVAPPRRRSGAVVRSFRLANDCGALTGRGRIASRARLIEGGEEVLKEGPATLLREPLADRSVVDRVLLAWTGGRRACPGRLYLTKTRLVFIPASHRVQTAAFEIALRRLSGVGTGSLPFRSTLVLRADGRHAAELIAQRPRDWARVVASVAGLDEQLDH